MSERVALRVPGMDDVEVVRDLTYRSEPDLLADLYRPAGSSPGRWPVVVFVHGDGPPDVLATAKEWGQYTSWGRLTAASGLAAITFNHRSTEGRTRLDEAASDVDALIAFVRGSADDLGVDGERIGIWVCSMGPPVVLPRILRDRPPFVRCVAALYGVMDLRSLRDETPAEVGDDVLTAFSPVVALTEAAASFVPPPPMLLARAGREERRWLNPTIDAFVAAALEANAELDLLTHPTGRHGFDVADDDERSRDIVARTVEFLRRHLVDAAS
jgi:acetyl esterase/lipase